jgi:hypothetical protein
MVGRLEAVILEVFSHHPWCMDRSILSVDNEFSERLLLVWLESS